MVYFYKIYFLLNCHVKWAFPNNVRRNNVFFGKKMLIGDIIGCSAKMISNALKWQQNPETHGRKTSNYCQNGSKNSQNGKDSANHHLQKDDLTLPVSALTVRRRLIEAKLSARSLRKAPLLRELHVRNRLKFDKELMDWPQRNITFRG